MQCNVLIAAQTYFRFETRMLPITPSTPSPLIPSPHPGKSTVLRMLSMPHTEAKPIDP